MVTIDTVTPKNILVFKEARLRALRDSPTAFGSTYAREVKLTDAEWMERARQSDGVKRVMYMALEDGAACGIAGAMRDEDDEAEPRSFPCGPRRRTGSEVSEGC